LSKLFSKVQEFYTEIEDDILANHQHRQSTAAAIDTKQLEEFYTLAEEDPTEIELLLCATENLLDMDDEYVVENTELIDGIDITEQGSQENEAIAVSAEMAAILFSRNQKQDQDITSETTDPANNLNPNNDRVSSLDETMQHTSVETNVRVVMEELDHSIDAALTDDLSGNSA
jgi:hypothetical protein